MGNKFEPLDSEEVLSVEENNKILLQCLMFTGGQLISQLKSVLHGYGGNKTDKNLHRWLDEGVDCNTLKFGAKSWQKGKIRIRLFLEFCPDEPDVEETPAINQLEVRQLESPLDDIRRIINQDSQQGNS